LGRLVVLALALLVIGLAPAPSAQRPQGSVDTSLPAPTGHTIAVPAGADLQVALDRARPGDVIALEPGATYVGPFTLPRKSGDDWIVIRTSTPDETLPPGRRVEPGQARLMPVLMAGSEPVIATAQGAHHYRLIG